MLKKYQVLENEEGEFQICKLTETVIGGVKFKTYEVADAAVFPHAFAACEVANEMNEKCE